MRRPVVAASTGTEVAPTANTAPVSEQITETSGSWAVVKDLTAGTLGGVAGIVVGQPLDTAKVRLQAKPHLYNNFWHCLGSMIRNEGVRACRWIV